MGSSRLRMLYTSIAVLIAVIAAIVAGILKSIGGSNLADAFLYGGGAFIAVVTVTLGLMSAMGLFDPTRE